MLFNYLPISKPLFGRRISCLCFCIVNNIILDIVKTSIVLKRFLLKILLRYKLSIIYYYSFAFQYSYIIDNRTNTKNLFKNELLIKLE